MDDKINAFETGLVNAACAAAIVAGIERTRAHLVGYSDHYYEDSPTIDEVPSVGSAGFAPYTNGGYNLEVQGLISQAAETGNSPAQVAGLIEQYIEAEDKYEADETGEADEPTWADGTYRYQVRVLAFLKDNYRNESGEDEVLFYGGVNPYSPGEDGARTDDVFEVTLPLAGLSVTKIESTFDALIAAFDRQWTPEGFEAFQIADAARREKKRADDAAAREYWSKQA